ncbi:MAG TPA: sn-glycerol-3-phosphate ABC transporter substrate-binding protein UgpB, partial [bacterium]|nr:sn-glycerol-3-phosphate ABC transporter substrate-binding protein UgpB [bacterium]
AASAAFLNYVASPDNQVWWHEQTGYLPITVAAYNQAKASGYYKQVPVQAVGIEQLTRAQPTAISRGLRLGNFVQIRTVIDEELENVWAGKKTAQAALDDAVRRGNELLRQFEQSHSS